MYILDQNHIRGLFSCLQISGRLFSDSGPRRSSRLAGEAGANTNASGAGAANNGTTNSTKYLGGSKLNSITFRSMAVRKGQSFANENIDEGNKSFCPLSSAVCSKMHNPLSDCWYPPIGQ